MNSVKLAVDKTGEEISVFSDGKIILRCPAEGTLVTDSETVRARAEELMKMSKGRKLNG